MANKIFSNGSQTIIRGDAVTIDSIDTEETVFEYTIEAGTLAKVSKMSLQCIASLARNSEALGATVNLTLGGTTVSILFEKDLAVSVQDVFRLYVDVLNRDSLTSQRANMLWLGSDNTFQNDSNYTENAAADLLFKVTFQFVNGLVLDNSVTFFESRLTIE